MLRTIPLWGLNEAGICNCSKGHACGSSAGRHPVSSGWRDPSNQDVQSARDFNAGLKTLENRGEVPSYGILCGAPNGVVVLDIDPRNKGWETWQEWGMPLDLNATETVITPRGGYHIYFRYDSIPVELRGSKKLGPGMDFISDGKYVVGPGCVQANGNKYISKSPSGVRSTAPSIDGKGVRAMKAPEWLLERLRNAQRVNASEKPTKAAGPVATLDEAREVLTWIDGTGYEEWISVGMAMHTTYEGSDEAFQVWLDWSTKFPSFDGEGDCRMHWTSFEKKPANPVSYGTIVWLALEGGMPRKKPEGVEAEEAVTTSPLSDAQRQQLEKLKWEQKYTGPFEDHVYAFPGFGFGLMKEMAEITMKFSPQPDPLISVAGAIGYFASFFSRRWSWGGMDTKLYIVVAAPSGGGKGVIEQVINKLHSCTGMSRTLRGDPLRSDSGALMMLAEHPRRLVFWDEFGDHMQAIKMGKRNGGHAFQLEAVIKTAYTTDVLSLGGTAKRRAACVFSPAMSIIGTTTRSALENALTAAQFEGGLMGRFLFFIKPDEDPLAMPVSVNMEERDTSIATFANKIREINALHLERLRERIAGTPQVAQTSPAKSVEKIKKMDPKDVYREDIDLEMDLDGLFDITPTQHIPAQDLEAADVAASWLSIPSDAAADQFMKEIQEEVIHWRNRGAGYNELLWSFWNRFPLQVRKLAAIAALADNPYQPHLHIGHVKWAFAMCHFCYTRCNQTLFTPVATRHKTDEDQRAASNGKVTVSMLRKVVSTILSSTEDMEVPQITRNKLLKQLGGRMRGDKDRMTHELLDMQIISAIPGTSPPCFAVSRQKIVEFFMDNPGSDAPSEVGGLLDNNNKKKDLETN